MDSGCDSTFVIESEVTRELLDQTIEDLTVAGISQNRNFSDAMDPFGVWRVPGRRERLDRFATVLGMTGFTLSLVLAVVLTLACRSPLMGFAFAAAFIAVTSGIRGMAKWRIKIMAWTDKRIAAKMQQSLKWLTDTAPLGVRYSVAPDSTCSTEWVKDGAIVRSWQRVLKELPVCYAGRTALFMYATGRAQKCQAVLLAVSKKDRERILSALGITACSVEPA